jgi:hypothetical protein
MAHISILPVRAAGGESDDLGESSALIPTNLLFAIR